ncbi:MAG TPA: aquaporin [Acidobacteriota bacterium]|nr:aquaporin [Acidobacteriota bacterium]
MGHELAISTVAEGFGTFVLTFMGAAAVCTDSYSGGQVGVTGIALAHGLTLAAIVSALGHVSGAHVNPAVTLGALLVRAIDPPRALAHIGAQLAGAVVAGLMLAATFGADVWDPVHLGAPALGPGVEAGTGVFVEMILTLVLVFVILQMAADPRAPRHVHGLVIGATLAAAVLVGGPLTGAALNPARAFGPALAAGFWSAHYVYWVGPLLGGVLAAVLYVYLNSSESMSFGQDEE